MSIPEQAAENFIRQSETIDTVEKHGRGIIHDTYLVKLNGRADSFILQRINTQVFKQPELIMHNLRVVCEHVHEQKRSADPGIDAGWQMLHLIPTGENMDFFVDPEGGFWRALSFISGAHPLEKIGDLSSAREVGRALGVFHHLTGNLDPGLLHDTLPGFHDIELYLSRYDQVRSSGIPREITRGDKYCRQFVEDRRSWAPVLENGRKQNKLKTRIIHGDPKINNVMVDNRTGRAVSIIDLDTVKPGLLLYDIGDCLRSCCNIQGEEARDSDTVVRFDLERCGAVLSGYMGAAQGWFTALDFEFLSAAIRLVPFELGLRFYTDYLEGNPYFKISYPAQNLDRAMVQFRLVESIEQQEAKIKGLIAMCRKNCQKV